MPAIDIARLKIQAAVLVEKFDQPAAFLRELRPILEKYEDRTVHKGIISSYISVLPAYRVPQAVLRQIEMEIGPLAATFPEQAMKLTEELWNDGFYESRSLAAGLTGRIDPKTALLQHRILEWVRENRDDELRKVLLQKSLIRIRTETPVEFLKIMRVWLDPQGTTLSWGNAIHAIIPLLEENTEQHIPSVYNLLSPMLKNIPSTMQNDLIDLIKALYGASKVETVHFLRQVITGSNTPHLSVTIRRILPQLPADLRPVLQEMVRYKSRMV